MSSPKKKRTASVAAIIAFIVLTACGASNTGTAVTTAPTGSTQAVTQATATPVTQADFKVGQVVSVGDTWQITVISAKTSAGSEFNAPQHTGNVFLIITVSAKNISGQSQSMSSLIQWNLQDSTGQKYDIGFDTDAGASLDGADAAGRLLRGALVYEVPKILHTFTLSFQNNFINSDQTFWAITV